MSEIIHDTTPVRLSTRQPVFLVGMMGAGKTTIGRALARAMNRDFLDLDHEIVGRCGVSIPFIFDIEGEEGFRNRESMVLEEVAQIDGIVLATGGGAVLREENRAILRRRGVVIYLKASADELYRRVAKDRNRPLLATPNPKARIVELLAQRESLYESVADLTIETGSGSISSVVKTIHNLLQKNQE
ncbi:shikimate kinase [Advenella sp. RU8]|uniref:shikimate kinase n=1 Tax=Advenella sp. RU8 TaxID=3399575 RepID=UPI003AAFE1C1